ncbi:serine beta-lactamase-like protein LACTB, mitochondrial isoform X2 [Thalassophryne amazonica]|uniref:serine beta-lactamase-like protein LACTB, mitochondrial isoform X2 n=1 Tax=Thalassophryne amazonica TaxID=390379 RepID=UPI001470F964|nr:serine beta-lactamase-like protein LACTB, mitochondrial isoform X2 [Thalassophryne amazonica]
MARLLLPNRFCVKYRHLAGNEHCVFTLSFGRRVLQQKRRYSRDPNRSFSKHGPMSSFWICGVGLGLTLAVGLKYRSDQKNSREVAAADRTQLYKSAIKASRDFSERIKDEVGAPGLVVGVSVDGEQVWSEGVGYADLENRVPCGPQTVMRIASVSKPLTTAAAALLCEEGKLDLDAPVQNHVPEFPQKQYDGQDVTITPRMILSHLSGIRHYEKDARKVREEKEKAKRLLKAPEKDEDNEKIQPEKKDKRTSEHTKGKEATSTHMKQEREHEEYYMKNSFDSVIQALDLFKDDPLIFKPGSTFLYSTHAFTLLSAIIERASSQRFLDHMKGMFHELGMHNTVPDENDPIIYHRSRYYHIHKKGRVVNCPYVDNSYKWAGGGFLSTVGDLLIFGNALLYSFQMAHLEDTKGLLPGFLKPKTAQDLWAVVEGTEQPWEKDERYAQGWTVVEKQQKYGQCKTCRYYVSHTGGAVGASSVLLVLPSEEIAHCQGQTPLLPQGVVVAIITNMQSVGLSSTALKIAHEFDQARCL